MDYNINELLIKIKALNSNSPKSHIRDIEYLLRDIYNQHVIPNHLRTKLISALKDVSEKSEYFTGSDVSEIVLLLFKKMTQGTSSSTGANAGKKLVDGDNYMKRQIHDPFAAYKILSKFGIPLFRI